MNRLMSVDEAAKYLSVSEELLLYSAEQGEIPGTKSANQWVFNQGLLDNMMWELWGDVWEDEGYVKKI